MTDRELLEAAAKAAGIAWSQEYQCYLGEPDVNGVRVKWLPLTDDGDALRLAVKLRIGVLHRTSGIEAHSYTPKLIVVNEETSEGCDTCAATRRAIVRAAARLGGG